jgi:Tfp pilus assembly protein PilV
MMVGITGRIRIRLMALHNKREARSRVAARQAHLHLLTRGPRKSVGWLNRNGR